MPSASEELKKVARKGCGIGIDKQHQCCGLVCCRKQCGYICCGKERCKWCVDDDDKTTLSVIVLGIQINIGLCLYGFVMCLASIFWCCGKSAASSAKEAVSPSSKGSGGSVTQGADAGADAV